ncbi:hypothetical protein imdm_1011 [gamma proteobacterium IMCC2047]|nr:hypothetical protein imdm_1011 [gamma proteobacterium IMCC2047]
MLTHEESIAVIEFEAQDKQSYLARLYESDGDEIGSFQILGDQWRLDAKFVKMKYWSNLLGLDSRYGLERLQGRYSNIDDENSKPHLAHDLGEDAVIEFFTIFGWSPFVDSSYGSSSYTDIDINNRYEVFKTQTGLLIRSGPIPVTEEDEGIVSRVISSVKGAF